MKKLLSIMLAAAIVAVAGIAMSACGSDNGAGGNNTSASASADATKTIKSKEDLAGGVLVKKGKKSFKKAVYVK